MDVYRPEAAKCLRSQGVSSDARGKAKITCRNLVYLLWRLVSFASCMPLGFLRDMHPE